MKKELCSVVVPCMNEEETIPIFYDIITKIWKQNGVLFIFQRKKDK